MSDEEIERVYSREGVEGVEGGHIAEAASIGSDVWEGREVM